MPDGVLRGAAITKGQIHTLNRRDLNPVAWTSVMAGDLSCCSGWPGCLVMLLALHNACSAGPAFLTIGPLSGLHCSICQGQTSHVGIDKSSTSQRVEDPLATLP